MGDNNQEKPVKRTMTRIFDGWANILTGMGLRGRDRRESTSFRGDIILGKDYLTDLYRSDGFARRIIDLPTKEMTREWFEIEGDSDGLLLDYLSKIGAKKAIANLIRWARLYGGSIGVMLLDDGQDLDKPLNQNLLKNVLGINVFDRFSVNWNSTDLYNDASDPKYLTPEYYTVNPHRDGNPFRVHESRVLRLDGEILPDQARYQNQGWGDSYLQKVYRRLRGLGSAYAGTELIIDSFILSVLTVKGLSQMLSQKQEDMIIKRLDILDQSRHILNTMLLDEGETYEKKASSVTGLSDLLDKLVLGLSAAAEIPVTLLMGQAPAGLNATGDSDIRHFYDMIAAQQKDIVEPVVRRLIELVMSCKDGPLKGKLLKEWAVHWNPLWQLTRAEEAEVRSKMAEADKKYIEYGVLTAEEVAESRFGGDHYSIDTLLNQKLREEEKGLEAEAAKGE